MARRRHRRRKATTSHRRRRPVARRRRRAAVVVLRNPPRRRRRRHHVRAARRHHRRSFRRNPPFARGLVGNIIQGVYDGAAVVAGQVVTRKAVAALQGVAKLTTPTATEKIALNLGAAVVVSLVAKKALPGRMANASRFIVAGAFAEAVNQTLAQTPVAPYLSAFPPRSARIRAYPAPRALPGRGGVSAYPRVAAYPRVMGMPQNVG